MVMAAATAVAAMMVRNRFMALESTARALTHRGPKMNIRGKRVR